VGMRLSSNEWFSKNGSAQAVAAHGRAGIGRIVTRPRTLSRPADEPVMLHPAQDD
jgi:hypothetical protein